MEENLQNAITKYIIELKKDDYYTGYKLAEIILLHVGSLNKDLIDGFIDKIDEWMIKMGLNGSNRRWEGT